MNLDINDIKSLCQIDKYACNLYKNKILWEYLLKRDNLYFEHFEHINFSIDTYKRSLISRNKLDKLHIFCNDVYIINLPYLNMDIRKILSTFNDDIYEFEDIILYKNYFDNYTLDFNFINHEPVKKFGITTHEMIHILLLLYYYYPNVVIQRTYNVR